MQQIYNHGCLSRDRVHEWYTSFKNGYEDINVGQISPENIAKVGNFLKIQPKTSLRIIDMELGMSKDSSIAF